MSFTKKQLEDAVDFLLKNPRVQMSQFHDVDACWQLIHHLIGLINHYENMDKFMHNYSSFEGDLNE